MKFLYPTPLIYIYGFQECSFDNFPLHIFLTFFFYNSLLSLYCVPSSCIRPDIGIPSMELGLDRSGGGMNWETLSCEERARERKGGGRSPECGKESGFHFHDALFALQGVGSHTFL